MLANPIHERSCESDDSTLRPALLTIGWRVLGTALERARQRRALQSLPDHLLDDIGLSRRDIEGECRRPFWR